MSAAEKAYSAAERYIAELSNRDSDIIDLNSYEFRQLRELPPQISEINHLRRLNLDLTSIERINSLAALGMLEEVSLRRTRITDIQALRGLRNLKVLFLSASPVEDISPLVMSTSINMLDLNASAVCDLRPLLGLVELRDNPNGFGLTFEQCAAAELDPRIRAISVTKGRKRRASDLFDYLNTLPPWPEPLPSPPYPPNTPPQDARVPKAKRAPIEVEIVDGALVRVGTTGLSDAEKLRRAELGWVEVKRSYDLFCDAFSLHNYPVLEIYLASFGVAVSDQFDIRRVIEISGASARLAALSGDQEFCRELPTGAAPLLGDLVAKATVFTERFPEVRDYALDAARPEDSVLSEEEAHRVISGDYATSEQVDKAITESLKAQMETALQNDASEETQRDFLASQHEVVRATAELALDGAGKLKSEAGSFIQKMDDEFDKEIAKIGLRNGGWAIVLLRRNLSSFRKLVRRYGSRYAWLKAVLDRLFGPEG